MGKGTEGMFISQEDAQTIVDELKATIQRDINIMDEHGTIFASTNRARIGQLHEGARVLLDRRLPRLTIRSDGEMQGGQPGTNLPIALDGETVGVIGITGPPEQVEVLGSVIQKMTEIMIESIRQREQADELDSARRLFLESWLFADDLDLTEFETRGNLLGVDITLPRTLVLLEILPTADGDAA